MNKKINPMRIFTFSLILVLLVSSCISATVQSVRIPASVSPESLKTLTPTLDSVLIRSTQKVETVIAVPNASETYFPARQLTFTQKVLRTTSPLIPQNDELLSPQLTPNFYFEYCKKWGDLTSNEKWAICNKYEDPVIFINQSNQTWKFSYNSFYGQDVLNSCTELLHTTNDGTYVYFSLPLDCMMIEPWFPGIIGVFRMNLNNGKVDRILGANYDFQNHIGRTYNVSISPTGRRMAYIDDGTLPLILNIQDLNTGENRSFQLDSKYLNGGRFKWSQDGTKLALLLASKPKDESGDYLISFAFKDLLKTDSIVTFIQDKEYFFFTANMEVYEQGVKVEVYGEPTLFYDLETGLVSSISK
jgi:hypothetical protein